MIEMVEVSALERSIKSIFIIALILLIRRELNVKSIKWANMILWLVLFIYLIFPCSFLMNSRDLSKYEGLQYISEPIILIDEYIREFTIQFGQLLSRINRSFVASLLLIYTARQIIRRNRATRNCVPAENDERIQEALSLFKLRRKVDILINDKVKVPITYGIIHPKIIVQSNILEDDELLEYVLIHELIHIKKFDIVFNHIKNLIVCLHWYNIFIIAASGYIEDDIEALCDKLVIQKVGDTVQNRKAYCLSMLKLMEQKKMKDKLVLKQNPTMERMIIMKKWKRSLVGVIAFMTVFVMSTTVFADFKNIEDNQVVSSEAPSEALHIESERVKVITDEEYSKFTLGEIPLAETRAANIDEKVTLDGLEHKSYKFNMSSWKEANHDGFTVKMSDISCRGGLNYAVIIKENGNAIYSSNFDKPTTLTVKAHYNSSYEVIIDNYSTNSLTYKIKINSYII